MKLPQTIRFENGSGLPVKMFTMSAETRKGFLRKIIARSFQAVPASPSGSRASRHTSALQRVRPPSVKLDAQKVPPSRLWRNWALLRQSDLFFGRSVSVGMPCSFADSGQLCMAHQLCVLPSVRHSMWRKVLCTTHQCQELCTTPHADPQDNAVAIGTWLRLLTGAVYDTVLLKIAVYDTTGEPSKQRSRHRHCAQNAPSIGQHNSRKCRHRPGAQGDDRSCVQLNKRDLHPEKNHWNVALETFFVELSCNLKPKSLLPFVTCRDNRHPKHRPTDDDDDWSQSSTAEMQSHFVTIC